MIIAHEDFVILAAILVTVLVFQTGLLFIIALRSGR